MSVASLANATETNQSSDILILGSSISAWMTASYLRLHLPELTVTVLGPSPCAEKRPIVGESTVEPAAIFFHRIGMRKYLEQEHTEKNGLSYYHKLRPHDPGDRRYSVHAPEQLHHLSRQLHRPRFDQDLKTHALDLGTTWIDGKAIDITLGNRSTAHQVAANTSEGEHALECRWVIDTTGRSRWLGKKVTTYSKPAEKQRSCFWFRVANFDSFLPNIETFHRRPFQYDLWYTTHHFMGRNNWIWVIPLKSPEHESLVSVGITFRPDLFDSPMRSLDDFLAHVEKEHPAIADMVRSGEVLDSNFYGNYLYSAEKIYSTDRWFLVGDAAHSLDPLYSTGLSMTVFSIEQIRAMISADTHDGLSEETVTGFEQLWMTFSQQRSIEIAHQYETMDDPLEACMRRYWNVSAWFNAILPLWYNGLFHDAEAAPVIAQFLMRGGPLNRSAKKLFAAASSYVGKGITQEDFNRTADFDHILNSRFDCEKIDAPRHFGRLFRKRAQLRWRLVKLTRYRTLLGQLPFLTLELIFSFLVPVLLRWHAGKSLRREREPNHEGAPIFLREKDRSVKLELAPTTD